MWVSLPFLGFSLLYDFTNKIDVSCHPNVIRPYYVLCYSTLLIRKVTKDDGDRDSRWGRVELVRLLPGVRFGSPEHPRNEMRQTENPLLRNAVMVMRCDRGTRVGE